MQKFENVCFVLVMMIGAIAIMVRIANKRVDTPQCTMQYKEFIKSEEIEIPEVRETQFSK